jgi:uncharacterized membrane protein YhiD involved in acid resistance
MRRLRHFTLSLLTGFLGGLGFLYGQGHFDLAIAGLRQSVAEQNLPTHNEARALRQESNYVAQNSHRDVILERRAKKARMKSLKKQRLMASTQKTLTQKTLTQKTSTLKISKAKLRQKKLSKKSTKPNKKELASR